MKYVKLTKTNTITGNRALDIWLTHLGYDKDGIETLDKPEMPFCKNSILENVVKQLEYAKRNNFKVMVSADYDNDGIYGGTILVKGFKFLGFETSYMIPNRVIDGYGMNKRLVDRAISENCQMIVTVDNGIACREAVEYALSKGLEVIVTDHHEIPEDNAKNVMRIAGINVIHPATMRGVNEFKEISGATVAYKLMEYLFPLMAEKAYREELDFYRALAGVTVISDVMPLVNENRTIFKKSVKYIQSHKNAALDYFISHLPNVDFEHMDETTFGFSICPVINAIGRLDNAELGIQYFEVPEEDREHYLAFFLNTNDKRKKLQAECVEDVEKTIDTSDNGICYFDDKEKINEGIIGILAGRICNNHSKPTIVFSKAKDSDGTSFWKGSARSTEQVSIINVLNDINNENSNVFLNFGGHAGAAGISIKENQKDVFVELFNKYIEKETEEEMVKYYVEVSGKEIPQLVAKMKELKPFGNGFPKPILHTNFDVNVLKAYFSSNRGVISNDVFELWVNLPDYLKLVRDNDYRLAFTNYQKLLFEGNIDADTSKTEYYRPKDKKIKLSMFGEVTSNYFGGRDQIKFDVIEKELI